MAEVEVVGKRGTVGWLEKGKEKSFVEFVFTKRQNFVYTTLVCIFIHKVELVL